MKLKLIVNALLGKLFRGLICSQIEHVPGEGNEAYNHELNLFEYVRQTILKKVNIRFDPGIIMLVEDGERTVMGKSFSQHFVLLLSKKEDAN